MSYFECPNCHEKHYIYGDSHIDEIAKKYDIKNVAKIPMNGKLAAACDRGMIELFEGDWLDDFVKNLQQ